MTEVGANWRGGNEVPTWSTDAHFRTRRTVHSVACPLRRGGGGTPGSV